MDLIDKIYKRIGIKRHSIRELLEMCPLESPVWDVYKKGCTLGINQCEQPGTRQRVMKYAPRNISELCAFVAAIRPGFKSMYKIFEGRKPFSYEIESLDNLIQTDEMPNSFILYQEIGMAVLNYAGIPMSECYEIIKNIAKKRVEKVLKYREQFMHGFAQVLVEKEGQQEDFAKETADKVWRILEDSSRYLFNASHSYSVALDSLYGAYLKTTYPLEFYETFLRVLEAKGDKERMAEAKEEAESYFGIKFPPYKFGQDNRAAVANHASNEITNTIKAIKGYGDSVGEALYACGKEFKDKPDSTFIDVLTWLDSNGIKESKYAPLIRIGYFDCYGNIPTLLEIASMFELFNHGESKSFRKDKENPYAFLMPEYATDKNAQGKELKTWTIQDCFGLIRACEQHIYNKHIPDISYKDKASYQLDILGYVALTTGKKEDRRKLYVTDLVPLKSKNSPTPWAHALFGRSVGTGKLSRWTVRERLYRLMPVKKGQIIYADSVHEDKKSGYWYLDSYNILE